MFLYLQNYFFHDTKMDSLPTFKVGGYDKIYHTQLFLPILYFSHFVCKLIMLMFIIYYALCMLYMYV